MRSAQRARAERRTLDNVGVSSAGTLERLLVLSDGVFATSTCV
jgi:hypothetical protein